MNSVTAKQIVISSDSLVLCDVRCGPTEDKLAVEIGRGTYSLSVQADDHSVRITVSKGSATSPRHGMELGELSIDGGVMGIYDAEVFDTVFGADAEEYYEWGDALFEISDEIRVYRDKIEPYEFACIPTYGDGVFRVVELLQGDSRVGLSLHAAMNLGRNPEGFDAPGVKADAITDRGQTNRRFRIGLECQGIPTSLGPDAARDIANEFAKHRRRHSNVTCTWDGTTLALQAENDFDPNGEALSDEFFDCVSARVTEPFGIVVVSIDEF